MRRFVEILFIALMAIAVTGCSVRKHVPDGNSLLISNKVVIEPYHKNIDKYEIYENIKQKPINQVFGWMPLVSVYYQTADKESRLGQWINNKIGKKPVYYSESLTADSRKGIVTYLNNCGFFKSKVTSSHKIKNKMAKVTYHVTPSEPYVIKNLRYDISDTTLARHIKRIERTLPVKAGKIYNAYEMDDERDIIVEYLSNHGYYTFTKDLIIFEVDTNFNQKRADVTVCIRGEKFDRYVIDKVFVHPDYKPGSVLPSDTTEYTFSYSYGKRKKDATFDFVTTEDPRMKFKTFNQMIQIHPGDVFNQRRVSQTYHSLHNLKIYSRSNIRFDTVPSSGNDTVRHLNCEIQLHKDKLNSYNLQLEGTNSAGNFGALGSITYKNNNIFHGSEILTVKVKGGYQLFSTDKEISSSGRFQGNEFGGEMSITFPRFLGPFKMRNFVLEYQPKTIVTLGYDSRLRPLYRRQTTQASFGYNWMASRRLQHILTPINLNSVKVDQSEYFKKKLEEEQNQRLKDQYTSHLIFGLSYSMIFSNQNTVIPRNFFYIKADIETSGNLLSLLNNTNLMSDVDDYHEIFGIRYAQYVKLGLDVRYFCYANYGSFAFRMMGGYGIPYGNSYDMPFEKSYNAGGANGMRGWAFRELGPGGYIAPDGNKTERIGNIQLEFNAEYRFPIYHFLHGAVFTDIGNIWNSKPIESFPNSEFKFDTFYKQLAMDLGVGLRFDFSFFLIRFDFAIPYRDPAYEESEMWRFSQWQWKNVVFNFGIGYPF
ncbi:MAG: BamA/TamA family outer membrane protein [Bacteroidales bacterium]|nr:BamA/TamA family outer membrane protein [Bacteroidales bacterium]